MSASTPWPEPQFVCSLCGEPSGPGVPKHFCWSQFWQITVTVIAFLPIAALLLLFIFDLLPRF